MSLELIDFGMIAWVCCLQGKVNCDYVNTAKFTLFYWNRPLNYYRAGVCTLINKMYCAPRNLASPVEYLLVHILVHPPCKCRKQRGMHVHYLILPLINKPLAKVAHVSNKKDKVHIPLLDRLVKMRRSVLTDAHGGLLRRPSEAILQYNAQEPSQDQSAAKVRPRLGTIDDRGSATRVDETRHHEHETWPEGQNPTLDAVSGI